MRPDLFHLNFEQKYLERMEKLRRLNGYFDGLLSSLDVNGVLDEYEAFNTENLKWLERMAGDESEFKKPIPRFKKKKSTMQASIVHVDDKENSMMPAPRCRPPRNKNRNTKSTINPRPLRATIVTRSSNMSDIAVVDLHQEPEPTVMKTRRTRQIKKESVCLEVQTSADTSSALHSEPEMPVELDSKKGRRTTRKRNATVVQRASKVSRASFKCKQSVSRGRRSSDGRELRGKKTSTVRESSNVPEIRMTRKRIAKETITITSTPMKRVTRNQGAAAVEGGNLKMVEVDEIAGIHSPECLLTPSGQHSVKQRVKEFEGLIDKVKGGESVVRPGSPFIGSPAPIKTKSMKDSPLMKSETNIGGGKNKTTVASSLKDISLIEEEEDSGNRTYQVAKSEGKKKGKVVNKQRIMKFEEVLDADDEWVSDEEDVSCKKGKSSTPDSTNAKAPVLSTKALRSRKIQKISTEISLTSVTKNKPTDNDVKEAELKKKMEKEEEARKRKEEIMKRKTEAMKKKREEKMAKVKRTREELEKDVKGTKAKKGRGKKEGVPESAEVLKTPLEKFKTPPSKHIFATAIANSTFNLNDQEAAHAVQSYDLTPCWQDVPPVQPDNPNDYGVADKSECSSEEENDPRKKIPVWAKIGADHPSHLLQALLKPNWITAYWHSKPRKPTILQFFGDQVSKRTLKRGLNYRTSSACWNTPPVKKFNKVVV